MAKKPKPYSVISNRRKPGERPPRSQYMSGKRPFKSMECYRKLVVEGWTYEALAEYYSVTLDYVKFVMQRLFFDIGLPQPGKPYLRTPPKPKGYPLAKEDDLCRAIRNLILHGETKIQPIARTLAVSSWSVKMRIDRFNLMEGLRDDSESE